MNQNRNTEWTAPIFSLKAFFTKNSRFENSTERTSVAGCSAFDFKGDRDEEEETIRLRRLIDLPEEDTVCEQWWAGVLYKPVHN